MESLATLQVSAIGYGIRYEYGIFDQRIENGWQVEITDKWLRYGNPWEIARPEIAFDVKLGGHTEHYTDSHGRHRVRWIPSRVVRGVAYDTPILGFPRRQRQPAAAVERARRWSRSISTPSMPATTTARSSARSTRKTSQGAVPERRTGGRQAPAPGAAVLLRVVRAAGHDAHSSAGGERLRRLRRPLRRAAERHASRGSRSPS
jgi:hypothetical protein